MTVVFNVLNSGRKHHVPSASQPADIKGFSVSLRLLTGRLNTTTKHFLTLRAHLEPLCRQVGNMNRVIFAPECVHGA